jgi:hypothetical protein
METEQVRLGVPETATGRDLGVISGGTQPTHQPGLSTTFQGGVEGQSTDRFQIATEATAGEQQGHG